MSDQPPTKLYKYQKIGRYSLENLQKNIFYFSKPSEFNDPYDCALDLVLDHDELSDDQRLREALLNDPDFTDELIELVQQDKEGKLLETYRAALSQSMKLLFAHMEKDVRPKIRVTCLSETHENMLMWSHYADAGKGFCIEFDATHPVFQRKLLKVQYTRNLPKISALEMNQSRRESVQKIFDVLLSTKSTDWRYEKEWRIISMDEGCSQSYTPESLRGVYFGSRITDEGMFSITSAIQASGAKPKFYKGRKSSTEFKIEFTEMKNLL